MMDDDRAWIRAWLLLRYEPGVQIFLSRVPKTASAEAIAAAPRFFGLNGRSA